MKHPPSAKLGEVSLGGGLSVSKQPIEVHLWGALRPMAGGASTVSVEAATIRELFRVLGETYPGMVPHIKRGIAVSINGKIYRDQWETKLPDNAEIYLMPRIPGG
jgi:sulfur-carrier protein